VEQIEIVCELLVNPIYSCNLVKKTKGSKERKGGFVLVTKIVVVVASLMARVVEFGSCYLGGYCDV